MIHNIRRHLDRLWAIDQEGLVFLDWKMALFEMPRFAVLAEAANAVERRENEARLEAQNKYESWLLS